MVQYVQRTEEEITMGLVTRRNEQLDELFNKFAVEPRTKPKQQPTKQPDKPQPTEQKARPER